MATSKNLAAYRDVQDVLDRAVSSVKGISVTMPSYGMAVRFRQRCYAFRTLTRELSREMYGPEDPNYGKSPYDELTVKTPEKTKGELPVKLEIWKGEVRNLTVEELT